MIIINEDKSQNPNFRPYKVAKYKGKMSHTLLVIEDVIDLSRKVSHNHFCICKCLVCGKIYYGDFTIRAIREGVAKCACEYKRLFNRPNFVQDKKRMLTFLVAERNKAASEAVFKEDKKRVEEFDFLIRFINSSSLKNYFADLHNMRL